MGRENWRERGYVAVGRELQQTGNVEREDVECRPYIEHFPFKLGQGDKQIRSLCWNMSDVDKYNISPERRLQSK